ncbi:cobalamin-binding protein [Lacimicrobium sp. SS2-24]|uniref:cobalamin-binding protein n=1 Tax=Lacimicrobium sp. SS2-24 TaxID=2005569 RepID=UPI00143BF387|nr:cobalamin-binding protein [Lacimicrobium sp. SS2-24]
MRRLLLSPLLLISLLCQADAPQRLISLAPHTTELVYSLQAGDKLLAVSDYSDYPSAAQSLPRIASYQGINFEALIKLQPDLVLVWQGGNKPQDIRKLQTLRYPLFISSPARPLDIADEIEALGALLGKSELAATLAHQHRQALSALAEQYRRKTPLSVFYYMHPKPLMSIGSGAWANHLLSLCNSDAVFADAINDYPEVTMEEVIKRQPQAIIAAQHQPMTAILEFWRPWLPLLDMDASHIIQVNPDQLHRFSLRLSEGVTTLCEQLDRLR